MNRSGETANDLRFLLVWGSGGAEQRLTYICLSSVRVPPGFDTTEPSKGGVPRQRELCNMQSMRGWTGLCLDPGPVLYDKEGITLTCICIVPVYLLMARLSGPMSKVNLTETARRLFDVL